MTSNVGSSAQSEIYLATTIERKINSYKAHMPEREKQILVRNFGKLLTPAKHRNMED
ncbi:hypothetical protein [Pseudomonas sp. NBRC 100443]|uniref:hypothetical protein n=1 Tax=Pseudomonas sp. NBRC 100443 TaxID=1113665 RepID=UPI0024A60594|nr:hypothetical protein [Pseudomonas sp. NBRC 100443]GLU39281.1 hypothetical protein Pssp01_33740 [Pseudomonas sp. NBRC 100443]